MAKRGNVITFAVLAGLAGFLLWQTLGSQNHECTVAVDFNGRTNEATASASTEEEAVRQAQTTACGPITFGMNDVIACGNRPPKKKECRTL